MAKNALKSKIYAQLRMSALYLVNFQVKITKKHTALNHPQQPLTDPRP